MNKMKRTVSQIKHELFLSLLIFLPFLVVIIMGKVIFWGTASLQFMPWYQYLFDSLMEGNFPLWNSFNGMGVPFIANHQSAVFYPLNWLLFPIYLIGNTVGLSLGLTLLIPIHLIISGLGVMKILNAFNRSKFSQMTAGLVFAFSGYILTRVSFISMVWAYAWMPWIILACIQSKNKFNKDFLVWMTRTGLLISMQLLAGHAQTSFYTLLLAGLVVLFINFESFTNMIRKFISFLLAFFLSICFSAVQIFPTVEFLMLSQRSNEVGYDFATNLSLWPGRLITILFGNFWGNPNLNRFLSGGNFWEENIYAGVFPFLTIVILIWIIIWKTRKNQFLIEEKRTIIFWFLVLLVSVLIAFGKFFPLFPFLYKYFPGFSLFQAPVRFLVVYFLSFSILFGWGVDAWLSSKFNHKKTIIILIIFATLLIFSLFGLIKEKDIPPNLIYSVIFGSCMGLVFGFLTLIKDKTNLHLIYIKILFVLFIVIDLLFHNFLWENFQTLEIYQEINKSQKNTTNDLIFLGNRDEEFLKFNLFFRPDRLQDLVGTNHFVPAYIPNTNLLNNRSGMINNFDPLQPQKFTEFWNWLNNLSKQDQQRIISMVGGNKIIEIIPSTELYLQEKSIPSTDLIKWSGCETYSEEKDTLDAILNAEKEIGNNRCIFVNDPYLVRSDNFPYPQTAEIKYEFIKPGKILIGYTSIQPGWIVVHQNWFPGWTAILDNENEVKIERVDFLFQGIYTPAGKHTIELIYRPISFSLGLIISIIAFIGLIFIKASCSQHRKLNQKELLFLNRD